MTEQEYVLFKSQMIKATLENDYNKDISLIEIVQLFSGHFVEQYKVENNKAIS